MDLQTAVQLGEMSATTLAPMRAVSLASRMELLSESPMAVNWATRMAC